MPLANEWTELLGKIMAQILLILALSTRAMTERRLSELTPVQYSLADYVSEKFYKKLIGKTDVEDAFSRLESLTNEESLMAVAMNLEVTFDIDGNVKKIQVLAEDIDSKVQVIEGATQSIDQNVKAAHERPQCFPSIFFMYRPFSYCISNTGAEKDQRLLLLDGTALTVEADLLTQGTSYKRRFNDGSLLRILS